MSPVLGQPNPPANSTNESVLLDGVRIGSLDLGLLPIIGLLLGVSPGVQAD